MIDQKAEMKIEYKIIALEVDVEMRIVSNHTEH